MSRLAKCVLLIAALLVLTSSAGAESSSGACDIATINGARELDDTLSRRAVEVIERAASAKWKQDARLSALVAENATVSLGGGDVGRPLGTGVAGVRKLAETMHADSYRYLGWDYMDAPAKPCDEHKATVEFVDARGHDVSPIEFVFKAGRVVSATGWERSFESGPVAPVQN